MGRIRVYLAASFDGFIAGPNHELDWLGAPPGDRALPPGVLGFEAFLAEIGAMVMGRGTYDVVEAMEPWVYGPVPVLVATHRPLTPRVSTVRAASGSIDQLLDQALTLATGKDVYVDGGATVRAALDAGRVDELVVTVIPILLGRGIPLFAGLAARHQLDVVYHRDFGGGAVQFMLRPAR